MTTNPDAKAKDSGCCGGAAKTETKSAEKSHCDMQKDKPAAQAQKPVQPQAPGERKAV